MTQHLFNSDAPATGSDKGVLDGCFTDLYDLREHISTPGYTASTPWMTFSTLGNVGIGTAPVAWGSAYKAISFSGGSLAVTASGPYLAQNLYNDGAGWRYSAAGSGAIYVQASGSGHQWFNAPSGAAGAAATLTLAMALDNSGNLLVGPSAINSGYGWSLQPNGSGYVNNNAQAAGWSFETFQRSGVSIGTISQSGTTGVAYNTSSDYRLKTAVAPIAGSGAFVDALKPCTWTWISDGTPGAGFIAHELQAVSPGSVTGTKDAVDANGKPIYQAVEYGSAEVVAMLVAELQDVRRRLHTLEAR